MPRPALTAGLLAILLVGCAPLTHMRQPSPGDATQQDAAAQVEPEVAAAASDAAAIRKISQSPWAAHPAGAPWAHFGVPGKKATRFAYQWVDGRHAVAADAQGSASLLRKTVRIEPEQLSRIRFSWKVPALIEDANLALRDKDDSPVRLVLAFDGDRSRFSPRDMLLAELSRAITGEEMPFATLMYVWSNEAPVGAVITNPRTDRIRKLVLESGPGALGHWRDYERDVRADFERAFGEPPGALIGVAIMTDADNTRGVARAWYGPVTLAAPDAAASGKSLASK